MDEQDKKTDSTPVVSAETGAQASDVKSEKTAQQTTEKRQDKPAAKPAKGRGIAGTLSLLLILLVLLAALGGGGYFGWQWWLTLQQGQQQSAQTLTQLADEQTRLAQQVAALQNQVAGQTKQVQTAVGGVQAEVTAIAERQDAQNKRLLSLANTSREDWLLAEAEYLLRLANQRLLIEKDTRAAQGMVEAADGILLELDYVDLYPLRKSLADDLVKLKLASKVDKEKIYLELQALADNIQALPLLMEMQRKEAVANMHDSAQQPPAAVANQTLQNKIGQWFSSAWQSLWQTAQQYVRVRDHSKTVAPLLPPESDLFLRQNLRFLLAHAQLAMLQEQSVIYQQSLEQAQQWLRDYYQLSEPAENFIAQLETLKQVNIVQNVPDISASSRELRAYIERLHKVGKEAAPVEAQQ